MPELTNRVTRREFIIKSLRAGAAAAISPLLIAIINSCGPSRAFVEKERTRLKNIVWDANPAIPVPDNGCYTGFFNAMPDVARVVNWTINDYVAYAKKLPTVMSPGTLYISCSDGNFPKESCDTMIKRGVIPYLRYMMSEDFKGIINGKADKDIVSFAQQIKEFKNPVLLVPYPEINVRPGHFVWSWGNYNSKDIVKAWRHMHNIFREVGANDNTVWGIHFVDPSFSHDAKPYSFLYPGDEYVDWIGFTIQAAGFGGSSGRSFNSLFSGTYSYFKRYYENKPLAIFELAAQSNDYQPKWINNTFDSIKKYPALKLFVWYNSGLAGGFYGQKGQNAYGNAISDKYFIGSMLSQKKYY